MGQGPVVLFDGGCGLCHAAVRFAIARDRAGALRFAALRSETGTRLLREQGRRLPSGAGESVLLLDGEEVHAQSDAVLQIAWHLDGAWPLLAGLALVPRFLRDPLYELVARHRHRWFGRAEGCPVSDQGQAWRFLR
jgi:predicted DCC family thiol-disulfide oxidoreductase YuxK